MCWHPDRANLEQRIMDGTAISLIADEIEVNPSAVYRHLRLHFRSEMLAELSRAHRLHVADLAERLVNLLGEAETVRAYAKTVNDPRLLLQAADSERSTVTELVKRLGIDTTDLISDVREGLVLSHSVARVLARHPDVLQELVADLSQTPNGSDLAAAYSALSTGPAPVRSIPPKENPA